MQIYNGGNIDHNSRFILSIVIGILCAVALGIAYGAVQTLIRIEFEYMYILIGWLIGEILKKFGHGVTRKYQILGAILAVLSILIGDTVVRFGISGIFMVLKNPSLIGLMLRSLLASFSSLWGMLGILFRIVGVMTAYRNSIIF